MSLVLCNSFEDAVIAYIVKRWTETSTKEIGRTIIQKICYFLKAKGTPLSYEFDIHHYGPYSHELYHHMDQLIEENIIADEYCNSNKSSYKPGPAIANIITNFQNELNPIIPDIEFVVATFNKNNPHSMELFATIHYLYVSYFRYFKHAPDKNHLIQLVIRVKGYKFKEATIGSAIDGLYNVGLFEWKYN